jgi:hypothetical protein
MKRHLRYLLHVQNETLQGKDCLFSGLSRFVDSKGYQAKVSAP